jgi:hypothetical protein
MLRNHIENIACYKQVETEMELYRRYKEGVSKQKIPDFLNYSDMSQDAKSAFDQRQGIGPGDRTRISD